MTIPEQVDTVRHCCHCQFELYPQNNLKIFTKKSENKSLQKLTSTIFWFINRSNY